MLVLTLDDISSQGRVYMLVLVAPGKYNLFLSLVEYGTMTKWSNVTSKYICSANI